jgi:hypothetical protein
VTKIAVDPHAELCMIALTIEDTAFWPGWVGCGGWSACESWPGVTKLTAGSWLFLMSVRIWLVCTGGEFLIDWMYCGAFHIGARP